MIKKNIQLGVWIRLWIDILNVLDFGENEFLKVCFFFWKKRIENLVFVCLDGSSLFRAVSEAVRNNE
jgi:hypothetical protein